MIKYKELDDDTKQFLARRSINAFVCYSEKAEESKFRQRKKVIGNLAVIFRYNIN